MSEMVEKVAAALKAAGSEWLGTEVDGPYNEYCARAAIEAVEAEQAKQRRSCNFTFSLMDARTPAGPWSENKTT